MKKHLIFILFLLSFFTLKAQSIARVENAKIDSKTLNQQREILIYTPVEYDIRQHEFFNVIYVFDSQAREMFDYVTSIIPFLTNANHDKSFIVVGITSPYNLKLDYSRSNDFLPVLTTEASINWYKPRYGNIDNFLNYVSNDVIPYINKNYRTKGRNIAVGHSLGASFILHSLIETPNLFHNYIAISPNFAYDNHLLAEKLINFDYSKIENLNYLYFSNASEEHYWHEWKPAREKVYNFFNNNSNLKKVVLKIEQYPNDNHLSLYPDSVKSALNFYFENVYNDQENILTEQEYKVTIKVKVPDKNDEIFITGNQKNLANWNPKKIKLHKTSDFEREITLKLKSMAEFKFTRGSWETEAEIKTAFGNIKIKPEKQDLYQFEIESYYDRE